ncbi:MAG: hypothetical protein JETCAE01_01180 [Anaerolineaceae bacterium]|nr:MAG: hypothetical protein JETCAE01_01180 [Anaerolineaceae bacterium]
MSKFEASYTRVTNTDNDLYAMLADVASQQGDAEVIAKYAHLAEREALEYRHILHQAVAHRAWGVYHRLRNEYDESALRLHKALDIFKILETKWQIGRTYLELGKVAETIHDFHTARSHYNEALKAFEEMKATPAVTTTRKRLNSLPA